MKSMKSGDLVMIYESDLLTKPEGEARLVKKISDLSQGEYWRVEFVDDGFVADRIIWNTQMMNGGRV